MASGGQIHVEGYRELNRALRKAAPGMEKAVGRANKRVGAQFIERWLRPRPVPEATGGGASVRPSAAKGSLTIRVGGKHRVGFVPVAQWGRQHVRGRRPNGTFAPAPDRPYILRSVSDKREFLYELWLSEISRELREAGGLD